MTFLMYSISSLNSNNLPGNLSRRNNSIKVQSPGSSKNNISYSIRSFVSLKNSVKLVVYKLRSISIKYNFRTLETANHVLPKFKSILSFEILPKIFRSFCSS